MVSDRLSDFVTRIRNGYQARLVTVEVPVTKSIERLTNVLIEDGFLESAKTDKKLIIITLKYKNKEPAIVGIKRVSKPGARVYRGVNSLPKVLGGLGVNILSTPRGILTEKKARKLNTGGEIIAQVW